MFFNQDDDDQDFLSPTGGSKLASLFGMDQASSQGGNESLRYSAPKEPKKKKPGETEEPAAAAAGPAVLHAAAAHCYKYVDGKYASQGKLGVAVIGNHTALDYKILLYVSKEKQITHAHITAAFNLTILPNKYVSFYDDMRQGWSVMFDTQDGVTAFAKHVALSKANSAGPALDALVCQDLTLGEGGPLESNDSAEIKYTGNLLQKHTFGEEFDSNANADKLFRFKLGKGKVIKGWEEGVLGMKKLGRRLLVVPPSLGYGSAGMGTRVPPSATLIFDIEVIRVKLAKAYTEPEPAPAADAGQVTEAASHDKEPVNTSATTTDTDGESVKARTKSISDQLSQTESEDLSDTEVIVASKSDKAKLISRMAKMGKPMIPPSGAVAADPEDSDDETVDSIHPGQISPKPMILPKPVAVPAAVPAAAVLPPQQPTVDHSIYAQQMAAQQAAMMGQQMAAPPQTQPINTSAVFQGVQMPSQMAVYQPPLQQQFMNPYQQAQYGFQQQQYPGGPQQAPTPPPPAASDVHTPVLLSEARQQNTEVRLSLSKLQDKVEKIHEKLDHINSSQAGHGMALGVPGSMPMMETSILLHSIQRIVQENERLKKEIFEKNARVESQNDKISDLLQRNQKYMEQSNTMLEQRNDSFKSSAEMSQTRLLQLEQERVTLVTELASERSQVGTLQLEVANIKKREVDLRTQLESLVNSSETHREDFSSLRAEKADLSGKLDQLTSSLKEERLNRKQLEGQLSTLQEDLADLKVTNENLEKNLAERKKKALSEKKRLEEEIEEIKSQHEEEISSLKDKLRKQKSSIDATASEQVAEAEEELGREWKDKCDRLLASAEDKHQRALEELEQEKARVEEQLSDMEKKAAAAKAAKGDTNKKVEQLQGEVESLQAWKDKYEHVRTQAATMKERYEERIADMEAEKEKIIGDAQEAINRARAGGGGGGASKEDLVSEVKKIMNSVYHDLKKEFDTDKSYKGADIHGAILNTVKNTTMKMVQSHEEDSEGEEEGSEEEEEVEIESEELESEEEETTQVTNHTDSQPKIEEVKSDLQTTSSPVKEEVQNKTTKTDDIISAISVQNQSSQKSTENVVNEQHSLEDEVDTGKEDVAVGSVESQILVEKDLPAEIVSEIVAVEKSVLQSQPAGSDKAQDRQEGGGVEEDMEVAAVAAKVSAPVGGKKDAKKDAKPAAKGGFSLADLESNIITGDLTDDKGKPAKSPEAKKSKPDSQTVPVVAMVTGDKGNPYYAEELRQAAEKAKAEQAKMQTGASKVKETKVEPVVAPITGDKGNPFYAEELRKAAEAAKAAKGSPEKSSKDEVVKPATASTTASAPTPKGAKDTVEKPVSMQTTAAAPAPAKGANDPKTKAVAAAVCGDKGNPYYAEELRQAAEAAKDKAAKEKSEKAHVTGDKGNPYYAAELEGKTLDPKHPDAPKRTEKEVIAGIEASVLAFTGFTQKVDDTQTKKEKDSDNKSQKEKKEEKKDDKKKSTDKKAALFDDDDDDDMFAKKPAKKDQTDKTPAAATAAAKKTDEKKPAPAKGAKKGSDSEDDMRKPPPPPLFGEEEEDDDWLS